MSLHSISQVSRAFHISTRTLRYYEQIGLLDSTKINEYAYRAYDETAIERLSRILILRKLRIPLKQINEILHNCNSISLLTALQSQLRETDNEMVYLSAARALLNDLISDLKNSPTENPELDLLKDKLMLKFIAPLSTARLSLKEEMSMSTVKEGSPRLKDVRIVYLPPATVLSSHFIGENPEEHSATRLDDFVRKSGLCVSKPDLRQYGFNHPNPSNERPYGYERWVTIPEQFEVPDPFLKKHFKGGLFAAHMIPCGAFEEWNWLIEWVRENDKYEADFSDPDCMSGCLEEHLNYVNYVRRPENEPYDLQLDLLVPIKPII